MQEYNAKDTWAARVMLTVRRSALQFSASQWSHQGATKLAPRQPALQEAKGVATVYDNGVGDGVLLAWFA